MAYQGLSEVTGISKKVTNRNKYTNVPFIVGWVLDEVTVSDGEQKYFVQLIRLANDVVCEGDSTQEVLRFGYYTKRTDGQFCLGSQFAPIVTPGEWRILVEAVKAKGWLERALPE
jgi:hypothetical protein